MDEDIEVNIQSSVPSQEKSSSDLPSYVSKKSKKRQRSSDDSTLSYSNQLKRTKRVTPPNRNSNVKSLSSLAESRTKNETNEIPSTNDDISVPKLSSISPTKDNVKTSSRIISSPSSVAVGKLLFLQNPLKKRKISRIRSRYLVGNPFLCYFATKLWVFISISFPFNVLFGNVLRLKIFVRSNCFVDVLPLFLAVRHLNDVSKINNATHIQATTIESLREPHDVYATHY